MIQVVLDTNIVISGSLWSGTPKDVIQKLKEGKFLALATEAMLDELKEVIQRPKFSKRLELLGKSADEVVADMLRKLKSLRLKLSLKMLPQTPMMIFF
jgi:putative PIN family toxin of toxin-antitoxin system